VSSGCGKLQVVVVVCGWLHPCPQNYQAYSDSRDRLAHGVVDAVVPAALFPPIAQPVPIISPSQPVPPRAGQRHRGCCVGQAVTEATLKGHHKGNGLELGARRVVRHNTKPQAPELGIEAEISRVASRLGASERRSMGAASLSSSHDAMANRFTGLGVVGDFGALALRPLGGCGVWV
jgi:hypothetical protein